MTKAFISALALASALSIVSCAPGRQPLRSAGEPGGAAFAGGLVAQPISLLMTDLDADRDRTVTRGELDAGIETLWRELDADGDGAASALELADWLRRAMGSDTAVPGRLAFDRNADGRISRGELAATLEAEFGRLDADQSAAVERDELVRLVEPPGLGSRGGVRAVTRRAPQGGGGREGPLTAEL